MPILIRQPLNLGAQIFRLNRADPIRTNKGVVFGKHKPGWWEAADCRAADCDHYRLGWVTTVDPNTVLGGRQSTHIRTKAGRSFREEGGQDGLVRFMFEPGQKCFRGPHQIPVQRDPVFLQIARGRDTKVHDYDSYFDTFNETITQIRQKKREF